MLTKLGQLIINRFRTKKPIKSFSKVYKTPIWQLIIIVLLLLTISIPANSVKALYDPLSDPSFEQSLGSSTYWGQNSTNFGSPLCSLAVCGNGGGTAGPRSGNVWGWFGGTTAYEDGLLYQGLEMPACVAYVILQFYFWIGTADAGSDASDYFTANIGGAEVFRASAAQKNSYSS